jgi:hypothetical protein
VKLDEGYVEEAKDKLEKDIRDKVEKWVEEPEKTILLLKIEWLIDIL